MILSHGWWLVQNKNSGTIPSGRPAALHAGCSSNSGRRCAYCMMRCWLIQFLRIDLSMCPGIAALEYGYGVNRVQASERLKGRGRRVGGQRR